MTVAAVVSDPAIRGLSAVVDWQDGTTDSYSSLTGSLTVTRTKTLKTGFYAVTLRASNSRYPVPDTAQVTFTVQIKAAQTSSPNSALLLGPILPKDTGAPNAQQWLFSLGTDVEVLESSVKMLLSTQVGERLMSNYGTRLSAILFEPGLAGVESRVQEEIVGALAAWEPRVRLLKATVDKQGSREVRVDLLLQSVLTGQNFGTFLEFA